MNDVGKVAATYASRYHQTRAALSELRELSTLAYHAMCDAEAVIATVDPESADEGEKLRELRGRLHDCALNLFTVLGLPVSEFRGAA